MALDFLLDLSPKVLPLALLLLFPLLAVFLRLLRLAPFHPLAHVPGPILPRVSSLWLTYHAWIGDECTVVHRLHQKYGPVVRTGPMSVDISDGEALNPIYVEKGGFRKAAFYGNFDIDGHKSIFSELVPERRAIRAKAVLPMFSMSNLRDGSDVLYGCVDKWVEAMKLAKALGKPVNILELTRGLAVDAVTAYLFGKRFGGVEIGTEEKKAVNKEVKSEARMSASGMVDCFVAVGRYWYLPLWAFGWMEWAETRFFPDYDTVASMEKVDNFVADAVGEGKQDNDSQSYQARLLQAGLTISETRAQCKDLIFAGTDSTGRNLAEICFQLAKHPDRYDQLKKEILEAKPTFDDLQKLPYLRGVIHEALRISMANPSRLPRVVSEAGWSFKGTYLPSRTEVSCTPFELHFNENVFEDPREFRPERWIDPSESMKRDSIPFGLGPRQCIARNLATVELYCAVQRLVEADLLNGAKCVEDDVKILEWFNSAVIGHKIELVWA